MRYRRHALLPLLLLLGLTAATPAITDPLAVPITLDIGSAQGAGADAARAALAASTVGLCALDWALRRDKPATVPMFRDLVLASGSGCAGGGQQRVPWQALREEYAAQGCSSSSSSGGGGAAGCLPSGLVFHQSRCGSTLVGNVLGALPGALGYSEASPPSQLLTSPALRDLPPEEMAEALRILVAAMARPLRASGGGTHVFLKLQSALTLTLPVWRAAFPAVPWAFVHRDGTEVLASLLRGAASLPPPTAPPQQHLRWGDAGLVGAPCLRPYGAAGRAALPALHAELFRLAGDATPPDLPPEQACAAHVGLLGSAALAAARAAGGRGRTIEYSALPGAAYDLIGEHFGLAEVLGLQGSAVRASLGGVASLYSKARGGADAKAAARMGFGAGGVYVEDSDAKQASAWPALKEAAQRYVSGVTAALREFSGSAQAAAGPGAAAAGAAVAAAPAPAPAPPAAPAAAPFSLPFSFAAPLLSRVATALSGDAAGAPPPADPLSPALAQGLNRNLLPMGQGYPALFPLAVMLDTWNPDATLPPPSYGAFSSLRTFNFSQPGSLQAAEVYRRHELPFVIQGIPSLERVVGQWGSDEELVRIMGSEVLYPTDVNTGQHFMYYNKQRAARVKDYVPPTQEGYLSIGDWLGRAHASLLAVRAEERSLLGGAGAAASVAVEEGAVGAAVAQAAARSLPQLHEALRPMPPFARQPREMHYLRASTQQAKPGVNAWIWEHLQYLRSGSSSDGSSSSGAAAAAYGTAQGPSVTTPEAAALQWPFFLIDAAAQRGIHCRFGMGGIIAEAHSDGGRNFITMQRGHKRYVLSPPEECSRLSILREGLSARHSSLDWSAGEGIEELRRHGALGTEVVIGPGDALYVPAGWFHFIVSLDTNVQCNTRSGTPPVGVEALEACGVAPPTSEVLGEFTDLGAVAAQAQRSVHYEAWAALWPKAVLQGLSEAYRVGLGEEVLGKLLAAGAEGAAAAPAAPAAAAVAAADAPSAALASGGSAAAGAGEGGGLPIAVFSKALESSSGYGAGDSGAAEGGSAAAAAAAAAAPAPAVAPALPVPGLVMAAGSAGVGAAAEGPRGAISIPEAPLALIVPIPQSEGGRAVDTAVAPASAPAAAAAAAVVAAAAAPPPVAAAPAPIPPALLPAPRPPAAAPAPALSSTTTLTAAAAAAAALPSATSTRPPSTVSTPHLLALIFLVLVGASAIVRRACTPPPALLPTHQQQQQGPRSRGAALKSAASQVYARLASSVGSTVSWRKRVYPPETPVVVLAELMPVRGKGSPLPSS